MIRAALFALPCERNFASVGLDETFIHSFICSFILIQENRVKETLRVVGLMEHIYGLSWLLIYLVVCLFICLAIVILFWAGGLLSVSHLPFHLPCHRYSLLGRRLTIGKSSAFSSALPSSFSSGPAAFYR